MEAQCTPSPDRPLAASNRLGQAERSRSLAVVWASLFVDYALMTVVIPVFPVLDAGEVATGVLFSSKAAVQIFSAPLVASVVDNYELVPLAFGLTVEICTTIVFAFTRSYSIWLCCRAAQGFASACIISSGFLYIQQINAGDNVAQGKAMGLVTTGIISGVRHYASASPSVCNKLTRVGCMLAQGCVWSCCGWCTV